MTTLWCRACGYSFDALGGLLPDICAGCQREALWSTEPPMERLETRWQFTDADLRDLKRIEGFRVGPPGSAIAHRVTDAEAVDGSALE